MRASVFAVLLGGMLAPGVAEAHLPSTAQILLSVEGRHLTGHWYVALRDLECALGLDSDQDGKITWGEVRAHAAEVIDYCRDHLALRAGATLLAIEHGALQIDRCSDGVYAVVSLSAELPAAASTLRIDYDAFFGVDPLHRGVLRLEWAASVHTAVFSPGAQRQSFLQPSPAQ